MFADSVVVVSPSRASADLGHGLVSRKVDPMDIEPNLARSGGLPARSSTEIFPSGLSDALAMGPHDLPAGDRVAGLRDMAPVGLHKQLPGNPTTFGTHTPPASRARDGLPDRLASGPGSVRETSNGASVTGPSSQGEVAGGPGGPGLWGGQVEASSQEEPGKMELLAQGYSTHRAVTSFVWAVVRHIVPQVCHAFRGG
jgi:hypothetical protein